MANVTVTFKVTITLEDEWHTLAKPFLPTCLSHAVCGTPHRCEGANSNLSLFKEEFGDREERVPEWVYAQGRLAANYPQGAGRVGLNGQYSSLEELR
jgi:hypothetical protein